MKKEYYLPKPNDPEYGCLGEHYLFSKIKHWKLGVILGYDWKSMVFTQRGFSFFSLHNLDNIIKFLQENGIEFKCSRSAAGWSKLITISHKKANLQKIDEMYKKYYTETLDKIKTECQYYYENYYVNQEYIDYVQNKLGCETDYYKPLA